MGIWVFRSCPSKTHAEKERKRAIGCEIRSRYGSGMCVFFKVKGNKREYTNIYIYVCLCVCAFINIEGRK